MATQLPNRDYKGADILECQSGLVPALTAVVALMTPVQVRGLLGTLTCRDHTTTDASVAKAPHSAKQSTSTMARASSP